MGGYGVGTGTPPTAASLGRFPALRLGPGMIQISSQALRDGCERAHDLFMLNRLRSAEEAASAVAAVYQALGVDRTMREGLEEAISALLPVEGLPALEAPVAASMLAGVLVGLLIADSAFPAEEFDLPVAPSR